MDVEGEKVKRFRGHVVQELYQTERDYVQALEFTVNHILAKIRLKAEHDNSITQEMIGTLFCNVEELLQAHRALLDDLDQTLAGGPRFDSPIASCYLRHEKALKAYKQYGEGNEYAQKILYELEEKPTFKAFFLGIMLLGGKCDASISSYLFKPIQRICKYPLLFRELLKYTPESHLEHQSTKSALQLTRKFCSTINEAKRRVERLEAIADWQSTVDGWEGSAVVDTCSELIKEEALIKISAGNIQERVFTLFDNLLVYCKRISGFPLRSKTESKTLFFRGRIPVANIEIENITDGTGDYHTSGVTVTHGWKIRNVAKDKWFVMVAKSAADKQSWMEVIRNQRDRISREAAGRARDTRALMLDKGEKLHRQMRQESQLLQDHRFRLRTYPKSFFGSELVQWLVDIGEAADKNEAVRLGQGLLENGVIHNVSDKHQFKCAQLLYRFRYDDGTFRHMWETSDIVARGVRVYAHSHSLFSPLFKDNRVALRTFPNSISGQRLVDWLIKEKYVQKRDEGVAFGAHLMAIRMLKHVTDDQKFKDTGGLYYQFCADVCAEEKKKTSTLASGLRTTFCSTGNNTYVSVLIPHDNDGYGFELKDEDPVKIHSVVSGSAAESLGICSGMAVLGIEEQWIQGTGEGELGGFQKCTIAMQTAQHQRAPLHLYLHRTPNEELGIRSGGNPCGFQIKGTAPAIVLKVEPGSLAARHGLTPGCWIQKVQGVDVTQAAHDKVVGAIKSASQTSGGGIVNLRVGVGGINLVTRYQYATEEQINVQVLERVEESPYIFSLPVQLFKLYEEEVKQRVKLLSSQKLTNSKVEDYLTELQIHVQNYRKVQTSLSSPRYPSYRPYGRTPSAVMESCPINLHTTIIEVQCSSSCGSPTSTSAPLEESDETSHDPKEDVIDYFWTTVAVPSLINRNLNPADVEVSKKCSKIRPLLARHSTLFTELHRDISLLKRLIVQSRTVNASTSGNLLGHNLISGEGSVTPGASPTLRTRSPFLHRQRNVSFANPDPFIKLILDGVSRKLLTVEEFLEDEALGDVVEQSCTCISGSSKKALTANWIEKIQACLKELASLPNSEPDTIDSFIQRVDVVTKTTARELQFHLELAISLCDSVDSTYAQDRLFSQCLVAIATSFAYHLHAATKNRLNPSSEYSIASKEASRRWLDTVTERGVLVCFQGLLLPSVTSELASLRDLNVLLDHLQTVSLHVKELPDEVLPRKSQLPPITLSGDHNQLHITFQLPTSAVDALPEALASGMGIKIVPVLFNKGLQSTDKIPGDALAMEQELNETSLMALKGYYRSLRQFQLNQTMLPKDEVQRTLVLEQISQPLNAMEVLVQQVEVVIRETDSEGVGLHTLVSELSQRMGGISMWVCNSGVYRAQAAASLAQVLTLVRSHGLVAWSLMPALSSLRAVGALQFVNKRNDAAILQKAFPQLPPGLYQLL